jgi:hypothetical protein
MGLTPYGKRIALRAAIDEPYVGLFTSLPDSTGAGGTEAAGSGYARKLHTPWIEVVENTVEVYRVNQTAVELDALTADLLSIVGWGLWTLGSGGSLIAFGPLLDVEGNEVTRTFASGNQPRFVAHELKVGLE